MEHSLRSNRTRGLRLLVVMMAMLSSFVLLARPPVARAGEFTVSNSNDSGPGSLRAAIDAANANADPDVITFDDDYTITLNSQLPQVTSAIAITGNGPNNTIIQASTCNPVTLPGGCTPATYRVFDVSSQGDLTLVGVTVRHGKSDDEGGGVFNVGGKLTVTGSVFTANKSSPYGGAIYSTGELNVTGSTFSSNYTSIYGGAIYNDGLVANVTDSTFTGNQSGTSGGAISNRENLEVNNSTFLGNTVPLNGGALEILSPGKTAIKNSTFSENKADLYGGGIYLLSGPTSDESVINSTFYNNEGFLYGSAVYQLGISSIKLINNLIYSALDVNNCLGNFSDTSGTLSDDTTCTGASTVGLAPAPLADNGGPTLTHALPTGSPAINYAGINAGACPGADQRGIARMPVSCDAGAYEAVTCGSGGVFSVANDAQLSEAIRCINQQTLGIHTINVTDDFNVYTLADNDGTPNLTYTGDLVVINGGEHTLTGDGNGRFFTIEGTEVLLDSLNLTGGWTQSDGGAIENNGGRLTIKNSELTYNHGHTGGGIYSNGYLAIFDSTLAHNTASNGGGVYAGGDWVAVSSSTFHDNVSSGSGGGIVVLSTLVDSIITNSTFFNNIANPAANAAGGAILNHETRLTVNNSTLVNNTAARGALATGAFFCFTADVEVLMADGTTKRIADLEEGDEVVSYDFEQGRRVTSVVQATLSRTVDSFLRLNDLEVTAEHPFAVGNDEWVEAQDLKIGDRVLSDDGWTTITSIEHVSKTAEVYNISVDGPHNYYVSDGASQYLVHNKTIDAVNGDTTVNNTIITGSTGGDCYASGTFYGSNNLIDDHAAGACSATSDAAVTQLAPSAADNGGGTLTFALLPGSNALDGGDDDLADDIDGDPLSFDQRGDGYPRFVGTHVDVGAYESDVAQLTIAKTTDPGGGTDFPFTIDPVVNQPLSIWGEEGDEAGEFNDPSSVALDAAGNVYVADFNNHRIQKFDANGTFLLAFGRGVDSGNPGIGAEVCEIAADCLPGMIGGGAGQFNWPFDLTVDGDGDVYVVEAGNKRVQKFDANGTFLLAFGWDVVDGGGTDFEVCESGDTCKAGNEGGGAGQFNFPTGIAVDAAGNVYVADMINHRIQKFDDDGTFLMAFGWDVVNGGGIDFEVCEIAVDCLTGSQGDGAGQFNFPSGVTVDADGNIYVTDSTNHRVQKFDAAGTFLLAFGWGVDGGIPGDGFEVCVVAANCQAGAPGGGAGQLNPSEDVVVDTAGNVIVADRLNNRIQLFDGDGTFLLAFGWDVVAGNSETGFEVCRPGDTCQTGPHSLDPGIIQAPYGVAVDPTGKIYVANVGTDRIQIFAPIAPQTTFTLDDAQNEMFELTPGEYLISELVPDGWEIGQIQCDGGNPTYDYDDVTAAVTLSEGDDVACTFHNIQTEAPDPCAPVDGNVITNFCFEDGSAPWTFHSDGHGVYNVSPFEPYAGLGAAEIKITVPGSNVQFYQSGIALQGDTEYELTFAAKSKDGRDLSVFVHKHGANYASYGLSNHVFNLTDEWDEYTVTFKTPSTFTSVNDARLRFWLAPFDAKGAVYSIDRVVLRPAGGDPLPEPPPPPDPEVPPQGECTATPGNLIANPGYEDGTFGWSFFTNGSANFTAPETAGGAYECTHNARVKINTSGNNVQLFQTGIELEPNTHYRLRLAAKATGANAVQLFVQRHSAPHSNYGLNGLKLHLTNDWQVFVVDFTTSGFAATTTDTRLRFWLAPYDTAGAVFEFDDVVLTPVDETPGRAADGAAARARATTADAYLVSGFFIDNNHTDRLGGGYVGALDGCRNARASVSRLWPANNKLWPVSIGNIGTPQSVAITGVWQDEPVGFEPDAVIGTGGALHLRAERDLDAGADGRVYTIQFRATYADGQSCNGIVTVGVPLSNRRGVEARSGGDLFVSTDK